MKCSLVMVGAHSGAKTEQLIRESAELGEVILIEPVPWLFEQLQSRYAGHPRIHLLNICVSERDAETMPFYAPRPSANELHPWGDQLGSMNPTHAVDYFAGYKDHIEEIEVKGVTFETLLRTFEIDYIDLLFTDTEGFDAKLLDMFPFLKLRPAKILFEHKHSDGVDHIGKNFGHLLFTLEKFGYRTRVFDVENCLAVLQA